MTRHPSPAVQTDEIAADWFALKRSGEMAAEQLIELRQWLDAAPEHLAAYREMEDSWDIAGSLREDPQLLLLRGQARRSYPRFRRQAVAGFAVAGVMAALGGWVTLQPQAIPEPIAEMLPQQAGQQIFRTGVGQRTTVTLVDGSVVTLDTDTRLRMDYDGPERRMFLDRGRAFFHVAKDKTRPFVVEAAGRTITALGTKFDVEVGPGKFEVTLVEGRVRVEQPRVLLRAAHSAELKAGYRIEAESPSNWIVAPANIEKDAGWVQGRLTFVDDPLSQVADEMNRYSDRKIVIRDPGVGSQTVVAVLKPGDLQSFVRMVRNYQLADVAETETTIELSPYSGEKIRTVNK